MIPLAVWAVILFVSLPMLIVIIIVHFIDYRAKRK